MGFVDMPDWDKRYAEAELSGAMFGRAPNNYLMQTAGRQDFDAASALCLADGDGRNGRWLGARGLKVTAVDLSAVGTKIATRLDSEAGVSVERLVADLETWSPDPGQRWAAVLIHFLHGPQALRERVVRLAVEALSPGGWLVVEGFARAQAARSDMGPDDPDKLYGLDALERWATPLTPVEALAGRVRLDEGPRHTGEAEIVRFAARRLS